MAEYKKIYINPKEADEPETTKKSQYGYLYIGLDGFLKIAESKGLEGFTNREEWESAVKRGNFSSYISINKQFDATLPTLQFATLVDECGYVDSLECINDPSITPEIAFQRDTTIYDTSMPCSIDASSDVVNHEYEEFDVHVHLVTPITEQEAKKIVKKHGVGYVGIIFQNSETGLTEIVAPAFDNRLGLNIPFIGSIDNLKTAKKAQSRCSYYVDFSRYDNLFDHDSCDPRGNYDMSVSPIS